MTRPAVRVAAEAPARLVLLPPRLAARLRLLPLGSAPLAGCAEPLAGSEPPAGSAALAGFAALAGSVALVSSVALAGSAETDAPDSTGVAARCSVALCSAAL